MLQSICDEEVVLIKISDFIKSGLEAQDTLTKCIRSDSHPDSFFINEIRRLSDMLGNKPMYVHFFTDDTNSTGLMNQFRQAVNKLVYGCEPNQANPEQGILNDFFNLTKFDCIIRPESHFSQMASKISDAKIIIRPASFKWKKHKLIITSVETIVKK